MRRYQNLDGLRAYAALAVLVGHAYAMGPNRVPLASATLHGSLLASTTAGVWLFFALSGFVISRPYIRALVEGEPLPRWRRYATRRVTRIYPLYWAALTVAILTLGTSGGRWWELGFQFGLLHNLVPGRQGAIIFAAWTLTIELLFYVFVPVAAAFLHRRFRGPVRAGTLTAFVVAMWIGSVVFGLLGAVVHDADGEPSLFLRQVFPAMLAAFCPGILLAIAEVTSDGAPRRLLDWVRQHRSAAWGLTAALVVLGIGSAWIEPGNSVEAVRRWLVVLTLSRQLFVLGFGVLLAVVVVGSDWRGRFGRVSVWLGERSYGIYLLHAVLLYWLVRHRDFILLPESGWSAYLVHVAQLGTLAILAAHLSWHLLERPAMRFGHRWSDRPPPPSEDHQSVGAKSLRN